MVYKEEYNAGTVVECDNGIENPDSQPLPGDTPCEVLMWVAGIEVGKFPI